jgi:hypothetical protein
MKISNSQKQQVIFYINDIEDKFKHSKNYFKELVDLKNKYIFMEINESEFYKDIEYLKNIKGIIVMWNL